MRSKPTVEMIITHRADITIDGRRTVTNWAARVLPALRDRYPTVAPTSGRVIIQTRYGREGRGARKYEGMPGIVIHPIDAVRLIRLGNQICFVRRFINSSLPLLLSMSLAKRLQFTCLSVRSKASDWINPPARCSSYCSSR